MEVLLKNKAKKKGQPKYDPRPYTITELHVRQALLERGEKKIRRETQKFKRFYEQRQPQNQGSKSKEEDDWEESWRSNCNMQQKDTGAGQQATTTDGNSDPQQDMIDAGQEHTPEADGIGDADQTV